MFRRIVLGLVICVAGCAAPAQDNDPYVAFARDYFTLLQKRDLVTATSKFDPELKADPEFKDDDQKAMVALLAVIIPADPPRSSKVVENRSIDSYGVPATFVVIEYEFPSGQRRFEITMRKIGERIVVRYLKTGAEFNFNGNST